MRRFGDIPWMSLCRGEAVYGGSEILRMLERFVVGDISEGFAEECV